MPLPFASGVLRLCVLLRPGDIPQWIGKLLLDLDDLDGVVLQVARLPAQIAPPDMSWFSRLWRARIRALAPWTPDRAANQRLAVWQARASGGCDATLALDVGLWAPKTQNSVALQWTLTDGLGLPLCPQFPLLAAICGGRGLHLMLNQVSSLDGQCISQCSLRLGTTADYGRALEALPHAVLRLVQQAAQDLTVGAAQQSGRRVACPKGLLKDGTTPTLPVPYPLWAGLKGRASAFLNRQKARLFSEYWRVGVINAPIHTLLNNSPMPPVRWLTQEAAKGYWADPFGLPGEPDRFVCEFFDEHTGVGTLEVLRLDAMDHVCQRVRLPVHCGEHVSFPNVFEISGRRLGVAETIASRECLLYEVDAAGLWHPLFVLLQDVAAADPALFVWEGRFWLAYTNVDMGNFDNLCLAYADQLEGPWLPHANNPVKVDIAGARMAGGVFQHNGNLYRPAQDCLQTYGAAVVIHRITELTPLTFSEVFVRTLMPDLQGPCPHGLHTLNAWGERTLVDGKRHGINLIALWRNLCHRLAPKRVTGMSPHFGGAGDQTATCHVLVYVPNLRTGGGEISMLRLAEGFAAAGLQVDLVVNSLAGSELEVSKNVTLFDLSCGGTVAAVWQLAKLLRQRRPDFLLSAFPHTNVAAVASRVLSREDCACVVTEHAPLSLQIEQQGTLRYRLLPPLVRWAYRRAHAVVAVSGGVRDDLQHLLGPSVAPQVISNPVLSANYEAEMALPPTDHWLRDESLQVVLSVGRLSPEKGLVTLVHAFAKIHRYHPSARLLLAGEGPDRQRLESLVAELELSDVVRLPGRTATPLAWMRHAAVFVLASQYEGFGNVLVEAMACGTPVVSTDCPVGPREILEGGRLGTLVPVGDVAAMAIAIADVLANPVPTPGARAAAVGYTQTAACARYIDVFKRRQSGTAAC
ncbi:MAG: glycosyltransferase [Rhodoferax sp.]|uniref:glycosyltransferase n=1 Tax=Rhodoferax sp. TaxID=50421 RepID=UPI00260DA511|nr:glycosyltransferase [Rhodoferax sp.]MDD2880613.1 glycosyltransferase [Rhodoferax sp.]